MTYIKDKNYYILNLTLGEYVMDSSRNGKRLETKNCSYTTLEKGIAFWNTYKNKYYLSNIHYPCVVEEFELIEVKDV